MPKTLPLRAADVVVYLVADRLTEGLIYLMVLFSPWAFGTSQPWAIWVMNTAGYLLGGLLAVKLAIRWGKGYRTGRWETTGLRDHRTTRLRDHRTTGLWDYETTGPQDHRTTGPEDRSVVSSPVVSSPVVGSPVVSSQSSRGPWSRGLSSQRLTATLAVLTVAILAYCLVSAVNASATYDPSTQRFTYHEHLSWLPHSFDSARTWFAIWSYLGLACSFWAIRDWLLGKSDTEQRPDAHRNTETPSHRNTASLAHRPTETPKHRNTETPSCRNTETPKHRPTETPARLGRLFWLLAINGGLLGLEGIIQRLEGSGKLLFLVRPEIHKTAATQFGPYAYYANASQYFNLLWPACLGFWWRLHFASGFRHRAHHVVLFCAAIMAACPVISTSRGGAIVTVAMLCLATVFLATAHLFFPVHHQENARTRTRTLRVLVLFFVGALALGFGLGWKALMPRMDSLREGYQSREQDYNRARPIATDYPIFGTGPGTFETVSQLYRPSTESNWFVQLHNDWLETRITFGWAGSALIALAFSAVVLRWFAPGGIHGGRRFVMLLWLALGGCLVHARFDFPFQMHSILFLFLVLCAVLFNLTRRAGVR